MDPGESVYIFPYIKPNAGNNINKNIIKKLLSQNMNKGRTISIAINVKERWLYSDVLYRVYHSLGLR
jgi:hypothetical protein